MACDISNIGIGACRVEIDSVDIGLTKGGVTFSISTEKRMLNDNHFGSVLSDAVITKRDIYVKVPFAESTLENLQKVISNSTLTVDGTKKRVDVYEGSPGSTLRSGAVELVLIPIGSVDLNDRVTIPFAVTDGNFSVTYQTAKERVFEVEFVALNDSNGRLMFFGDSTAV